MNDPRKIVPIEELRRKAAETGNDLESLSEEDVLALTEELRKELGELPDVRMDRVALAKARISKGYYTGERIAEGLLEALRGPVSPEPIPFRGEPDRAPAPDTSAAELPDPAPKTRDRRSPSRPSKAGKTSDR